MTKAGGRVDGTVEGLLLACILSSYTVTIIDGYEHSQDFTTPVTISHATVTMLGAFEVNEVVFPTPSGIGLFSVEEGRQVRFGLGNLVYKNGAYCFAEHQYDYGGYFAGTQIGKTISTVAGVR